MRALALACLLFAGSDATIKVDFEKELPKDFKVGGAWAVKDGMLRGKGSGHLEYAVPIAGDFTLRFEGWTAEKANVEVKLIDGATGKDAYTFAFLGQYHAALDGVKSCMLREEAFVKVEPRMWIYPGRTFRFEVRAAKGQFQMFLNDELGPFFVDPLPLAPKAGMKVRIVVNTEGKDDEVRLDELELRATKSKP